MQPEARLTKKIIDTLKTEPRTYVRKKHGSAYGSGWPDILGCTNGIMFAIEVKTPGGGYGVTKLQQAELDKWARSGAITGVVTSVDEAVRLLADDPRTG